MISKEAIDTIIAAGQGRSSFATPDGGQAFILPEGYSLETRPPVDPVLTHTKQSLTLHDGDSLIEYLKAFKGPQSRIFAEPGFLAQNAVARVVAVIDYHKADGPDRVEHLLTYSPRYSEAWKRWHAACREPMKQEAFAELIEECRADIRTPDAAALLDIVRTFKAAKKTDYDSVTYQSDGTVKLHYSEAVEKTGSSAGLPELMTLGIPVYYRDAPYSVGLFVRFRVGDGGVKFSLKLDRADLIEDDAFGNLVTNIGNTTGVPVHMGRLTPPGLSATPNR